MVRARLAYVKSVTRLIKIVAPILILVAVFLEDRDVEAGAEPSTGYLTLQTWTALSLWMRFFLYLRTRDKYDWYIRLIIESFYDMRHFLAIMMLGVLAFASAFIQIDQINIIDGRVELAEHSGDWVDKYFSMYNLAFKDSILTIFGQFDEDILSYRNGDWIVFLLCVIFNIIVLFNALIAVVSETFAEIKEKWEMTSYKEKATTIQHLQETIFGLRLQAKDPNELVFIAQVIDTVDQ